jgi:phage terminase large subunit GpA-like protein
MRNPDHLDEIWRDALKMGELCVTASEWADTYRILPANASAEPGRWRTSRAPYLREIMDVLSVDHPAVKVVIVKSNQVGGSEAVVLNLFGYRIHQFPCPLQLVLPRERDIEEFVSTRVDPMIAATPELAARVGRDDDGGKAADNVVVKRFPGGQLIIAASRSPASFRGKPVEVMVLDDLDACAKNNPEGDIVELASRRTNTFADRARKIVLCSTPTIAGNSPIEREFEWSSQQYYYVPCPHCGEYQNLVWESIIYERNDPATARYRCRRCAGDISEDSKPAMLAAGHWRAHKPEQTTVGFHLNALYSPWRRWSEIVDAWLQAQHALKADGDTEKLQTWYNLEMGRSFVLPDQVRLRGLELEMWERREQPFDLRSLPVEIITAGVDVQGDRVEVGTWGWAPGKERWPIGHDVIPGKPEDNAVWDEVVQVLLGRGVRGACVDTGSYQQIVVDQIKRILRPLLEVRCAIWGVKGEDGKGSLWPAKPIMPGETSVLVRIDAAKDLLYGCIERVKAPGPGFVHVSVQEDEPWFTQLFSERPASLTDRTRARYVKIDGRRRNEVLDCAVYATAALYGLLALEPKLAPRMLDLPGAPPAPSGHAARGGPRPPGRHGRPKRDRWI